MTIDPTSPRTRRALLGAGLGALAATVAGSVTRPHAAEATSAVVLGGVNTGNDTEVDASGFGHAFVGRSESGDAIVGVSATAIGVYGRSDGDAGVGYGVAGDSTAASGQTWGVSGHSASTAGHGVSGWATATSGATFGVTGQSDSPAGVGSLGLAAGGATGVMGYSGSYPSPDALPATGVYGLAALDGGRGGVFGGNAAQLRLLPSGAATHPGSGQAGDLFVDASHRLWFCKGGSTWKQIA